MGSLSVPRLSIIIPTLGNWEVLESTLVSVLQNRPARSEVVVVHNSRYEDPYDLKDEVRFVEAPSGSCLVDLINTGVATARSELIHLLACGAVVDDGWTTAAVQHFDDSRVSAVAPVILDLSCPARVLSAGCQWSAGGSETAHASGRTVSDLGTNGRWTGPDIGAAFYRRSALGEIGAFDATLSGRLAAIDLSLRLSQAGYRTLLEPTSRLMIDPLLLDCHGPFAWARQRERLFWRHARKRGWLRSVGAHGLLVAAETLGNLPRWRSVACAAGRLIGACDKRGPRLRTIEPLAFTSVGSVERRVDAGHTAPSSQARAATPRSRAGKTSEARSRR
jgi:cellulose synthase/poly-beta-1,6-N-acetylglucosamine synthase-like glycosyltransferase